MPYLTPQGRQAVEDGDDDWTPHTAGELNYIFSEWINDYLKVNGLNYRNINDCVGALECCKMELYRRVVAPYENKKISENGDVYDREILTPGFQRLVLDSDPRIESDSPPTPTTAIEEAVTSF